MYVQVGRVNNYNIKGAIVRIYCLVLIYVGLRVSCVCSSGQGEQL